VVVVALVNTVAAATTGASPPQPQGIATTTSSGGFIRRRQRQQQQQQQQQQLDMWMVVPSPGCEVAMTLTCDGARRASLGDCYVCAGENTSRLLAAGCSSADITGFCTFHPTPPPPQRAVDGAHFLGYNVVNLQSGNFSSDAAYSTATAAALHAGTLRYPGGNLGDWWDWRTGWCLDNVSVPALPAVHNPCYGGRSGAKPKRRRVYLLEEFKIALDATGALPVMMVNNCAHTIDP